jgi:hypothetical protein
LLAPTVEALAVEYQGRVAVAKLDVDANPETAAKYEITGIPAMLFSRTGRWSRPWSRDSLPEMDGICPHQGGPDGICPHQGGPLAQGRLAGCQVTCPWHGWQFDVRDGQHSSIPSLSQPGWPVRVEGEDVWIQVEE